MALNSNTINISFSTTEKTAVYSISVGSSQTRRGGGFPHTLQQAGCFLSSTVTRISLYPLQYWVQYYTFQVRSCFLSDPAGIRKLVLGNGSKTHLSPSQATLSHSIGKCGLHRLGDLLQTDWTRKLPDQTSPGRTFLFFRQLKSNDFLSACLQS